MSGEGVEPRAVAARDVAGGHFRYYDFIMAAFVAILLLSNLIGASKRAELDLPVIGLWSFGAGVMFFPMSYIIGDVLTEVYGYARARRVIWTGFAALTFMAFMSWVVVSLPPAASWEGQAAYEQVFGSTWRIVAASMTAFWAGEFANSFVMARMKLWTEGRHLWTRTIGSTVVGQGIDSLLFYPLAFYGTPGWTTDQLVQVVISQFVLKTAWEALLTPVTYSVVNGLKRREGVDVFDDGTDFTPFKARV
jgi:queuosine precursor transporter